MRARWLVILMLALGVDVALARQLPGAGGVSAQGPAGFSESHGWVALPLPGEGGAAVLHLPPRRAMDRADGIGDAEDGTVRLGVRLSQAPEWIAARENRIWIVFPREGAGVSRRVLTMTVERGPLGGSWVSADAEGRLPVLPSLLAAGELVGFIGVERGPMALLRDPGGGLSIWWFDGRAWVEAVVPDEANAEPTGLAAAPGGAIIATSRGLWRVTMPAKEAWIWRSEVEPRDPAALAVLAPGASLFVIRSQVIAVNREADGRIAIWCLVPGTPTRLATVENRGLPFAAAPLDQVGRLALVWAEPPRGSRTAGPGLSAHVAELSVFTGAVLYDGPARVAGPVSSAELKLLALALVAVMAAVLVFVLRSDGLGPELSLPKGFALAEPGRRVAAGAIDLLIAAVVAGAIRGIPVREMFSARTLLYDPSAVETVLVLVAVGFAYGTLGEWLVGRTLGKWVTGCRVVRWRVLSAAEGAPVPVLERPRLWRAAVRNIVRWALPPLAMFGMNSPDHRHRGDVSSGTVVVIRADIEPPAGPSPE